MKDKLRTLIFEAIGEASMCWEFPEKAGIFQSRKAEQIGIKLLDEISLLLQSAPPCGGITKGENMKLLKWLFGSRKPALNKPVVSSSLSFKEQMKQDIIPRVWQMAEEEKDHLNWLIDNNAPKDMIETSQRYLSHFRQRHKEYIEYADGL